MISPLGSKYKMDTGDGGRTISYWYLEYLTRCVVKCFIKGLWDEMIHYLDIFNALTKLPDTGYYGDYAKTLLLLTEACLRIYQKDFDLDDQATACSYKTFDQLLKHVAAKFQVDDKACNVLIRNFNKIWSDGNPLYKNYIDDCEAFTKDAKAFMEIIDGRLGKTFLEEIYEISDEKKQILNRLNRNQMLKSQDGIIGVSSREGQEKPSCSERYNSGTEDEVITQVQKKTRRLYNPRENTLGPRNEVPKSDPVQTAIGKSIGGQEPCSYVKAKPNREDRSREKAAVHAASGRVKVRKVETFAIDSNESDDSLLEEDDVVPLVITEKRRPFSEEEVELLRRGVRKYGVGNWARILQNYPFHAKRTAVNLKDKWRNMQRSKASS